MSASKVAIEAQEQRRIAAVVGGDLDTLAGLLSEDLVYVHNNGMRETKAQYLATAGTIDYRVFDPREVSVRLYGDVGIVNGHAAIEVSFQGQDVAMTVRYTAVYALEGDVWRMVSWHASAVQ